MSQVVLDICYGMAAVKHPYGSAVTKTMDGIDILETFRRKGLFEILPANAVYAMASEFLPPLADKDPVLIWGVWGDTVFSDIELE